MSLRWQWLNEKFAARARRERALIGALLVIGLPAVAFTTWVEPAWRAQRALQGELAQYESDRRRDGQTEAADPNRMAREELAALQARLARDQQAIGERSQGMVAPTEMVQLLERLLTQHAGVRLQSMRSLTAEPVGTPGQAAGTPAAAAPTPAGSGSPGANPGGPASALYRHGVELELEGSWPALRAYLAAIESSPRRLQWGRLQMTVREHPQVRMKLALYTLSLEPTWLQL